MPLYIQYMAAIIIAMIAYALIVSMMLPAGYQAQPRPDMIIGSIPFTMDQISDEVKSMEEQQKFLNSRNKSLSRVNNHRASCTSFLRGSCNCNRGAFTFSEINDVESQLLNTETAVRTKSIQRVRPETSIGLENFSRAFLTPNATDSLDAALSVGTPIPGESRGTGNQFFIWIPDTLISRHIPSYTVI